MGWLLIYQSPPAAPGPLEEPSGLGLVGLVCPRPAPQNHNPICQRRLIQSRHILPTTLSSNPCSTQHIHRPHERLSHHRLRPLLGFFTGLFLNFKRYLNPIASLGSVVLMYGTTSIAYEQWIIPWTTNLSSALLIAISLLLCLDETETSKDLAGAG